MQANLAGPEINHPKTMHILALTACREELQQPGYASSLHAPERCSIKLESVAR
jgi:hypothetical protein